jgi:hypothetical protein
MKRIVAVLVFVLALSVGAFADEVSFAGSTSGVFSVSSSSTLGGLSFTGGSFSGTTLGGFAAVGGAGNNFGTFSLNSTNFTYSGNFNLTLTLSLPTGATGDCGSQCGSSTAVVAGKVSTTPKLSGGAAVISFTPTTFVFSNADQTGSLTLFLNNVSVAPNGPVQQLSGNIFADAVSNQVPEPASLFLLGTGLLSGGSLIRRKLIAR